MGINWKKLGLAWIGGYAATMVVGVPFHTILMKNLFVPGPPEPQIPLVLIAYGVLLLIMAYMYPIGYKGGAPWAEGIRFGVIMGVLFTFPREMIVHATNVAPGVTLRYIGIDTAWHLFEQGLGGAVIALIYGRSAAPATT